MTASSTGASGVVDRSEAPGGYEMFRDLPDMCSTHEAATGLRCSDKTVRQLIRENRLFAVHVGRVLRIPKQSLINFAEGRAPRGGDA